jgi:hypothetical protein
MPEQTPQITVPERFRKFLVTDDFDRYGLTPGQPTPTPQYLRRGARMRSGRVGLAGCLVGDHLSAVRSETRPATAV